MQRLRCPLEKWQEGGRCGQCQPNRAGQPVHTARRASKVVVLAAHRPGHGHVRRGTADSPWLSKQLLGKIKIIEIPNMGFTT